MLVTPELIHIIERLSWYEYNCMALTDHRARYINFNADLLFLNKITNITHRANRTLLLRYPKRVEKYVTKLTYLFKDQKLLQAITKLETQARELDTWTDCMENKYNAIDQTMTTIMLLAEI